MRLLLAARLSQDRAGQTGIDTQDQDARAWAERNGHAIVATAADKISGRVSPFKRPNLGPWLTDPDKVSQYNGVLFAKVDRMTRGRDWGFREWAERTGKKLLIVSPELCWPPKPDDTTTPILWDNLVNMASAEWQNTSQRYRRMQRGLRDAKYLVGRPPFGYAIVAKGNHKTLEPDPVLAPYALGMVDKFLAGETFTAICEWLEAEGVKTPNGGIWQLKTVRDILKNTTLIGRRKDSSGKTVLRFTPILDDIGKWRALQHKLDSMPRKQNFAADAAMLAGVIFCDKCGGVMHRHRVYNVRKDGSRQYNVYYRCGGKVRHHSKCGNMIPLEDLDAAVSAEVRKRELPLVVRTLIPGQRDHLDDIAEIDLEIDDLDKGDPAYLATVTELVTERARLAELPATPDTWVWVQTGETYAGRWAALRDDQERREALTLWEVTVHALKGSQPRIAWPEAPMSVQVSEVADTTGPMSVQA
jgi:site-specific DNA recombinase